MPVIGTPADTGLGVKPTPERTTATAPAPPTAPSAPNIQPYLQGISQTLQQNPWYTANDPNIPQWENQELNQLYGAGSLDYVPPEILAGISQAESSGIGGSINPQGYGGFFGLGQNSSYGPFTDTPSELQQNTPSSFAQQAQAAAYDFGSLLQKYGGNVTEAENAYQSGPNSSASVLNNPNAEGISVLNRLGVPTGSIKPPGLGIEAGAAGAATGVANSIQSQLTPGELANQNAAASTNLQLALLPYQEQQQQTYLTQNYQTAQQQQAVQNTQLGLQTKLSQEQYGSQKIAYKLQQEQNTLSGQNIQAAISNIVGNFGYTQQGIQSGAAASGTYNTKTYSNQMNEAQLNEQYQLFNESQQQKALGLSEQEQKNQFGYTTQQYNIGQQQLQQQYISLGLSRQQVTQQYNSAIQQLQLGSVMGADQLEGQIAAMIGGGYSPLNGMISQLTQALPFLGGLLGSGG